MRPVRQVLGPVLLAASLGVALAGCGGTSAQLIVTAEAIEFRPARVEVLAGAPIQVVLRNLDAGVPHGLLIATRTSGVLPREIASLEITTGPSERAFDLPPLAAGPYLFSCPVHPTMQVEVDAR